MYVNTSTVKYLVAAAVLKETINWRGTAVKILDAYIGQGIVSLALGVRTEVWEMVISQKTNGRELFWDWDMHRK